MTNNPQQSAAHLRLGVLHYHWLRCGVTSVVNNALRAVIAHVPCQSLEIDLISSDADQPHVARMIDDLRRWAAQTRPGPCAINPITIDQLAYDDTPAADRTGLFDQAGKLADQLLNALQLHRSSAQQPYVLHLHNANLGKNPRFTLAVKLLADRLERDRLPASLIYQMHDFAEDSRPDCWAALKNCSGRSDPQLAVEMMYPTGSRVHWVTINSADRQRLLSISLPPESVTVLPNAVDVDTFTAPALSDMTPPQLRQLSLPDADYAQQLKERIADFARAHGYRCEPQRKILLAPIKTIRRKNVIESVLLLQVLNHHDDCWQLMITLDANSPADLTYSQALQAFVKQHQLPVTIGFGSDLLKAGHQRIIENGRVVSYSLIDLLAVSDAVVTTSIQEGFGYVFHEPWLAGKPLIGRNIPRVTCDFTAEGLHLDHLYDHLFVPRAWLGPRWAHLRAAYVEKLDSMRTALALAPLSPAESAGLIDSSKLYKLPVPCPHNRDNPPIPTDFIDYADLDHETQLYVLKLLIEDDSNFSQLLWTNSAFNSLFYWSSTDIPDIININRCAVACRYNLAISGQRIAALVGRSCQQTEEAAPQSTSPRSNETLLREALAVERMRLLA